jgi:stage V sporulation protein B
LKTIVAAAVMAASVWYFYDYTLILWGSNIISTLGACLLGCVVYLTVLLLIGGMMEDDMARIPMIGRFGIKAMHKLGVYKD